MPEDLIFAQLAREPVSGQVKTRLLPALSALQAMSLHSAMVEQIARTLCDSGLGEVRLWVDGDENHALFSRCRRLGVSAILPQCGGDLGKRMAAICEQCLAQAAAVVLVGSDAPSINAEYLQAASQALAEVDAVLGPALDGGYVLFGLRRFAPELFADISWGEDTVLEKTLEKLEALQWSYRLLETLPDIDRPEDLRHLPDSLQIYRPSAVA
jgi:rSAM/selenodomain-associated transferase 1